MTAAAPTSCFQVISIIQCYVDGECDAYTAVAIAAHLDRCRHCQEELANIRWLKAAVRRCHGRPESPPCH